MKKLFSIVIALSFIYCLGLFSTKDVHASLVSSISSVSVYNYCGYHIDDNTSSLFRIGVRWSSSCQGHCHKIGARQINGTAYFECQNHGLACPSASNINSISTTYKYSDVAHHYYWLYASVDSGYQNLAGWISKDRKYTLTIKSVESGTNNSLANVTGLEDKTQTIWYGNTTNLSRGTTNTGYIFDGFSDGISGDVVRLSLSSNKTVYAYYHGDSGSSSTNITVKNPSAAAKYRGDGLKTVYAKPGTINNPTGDKLTYTASYSPGAQKNVTSWHPQVVRIGKNGSWGAACGGNNTALSLNSLFNQCKGGNNSWNNTYSVTKDSGFWDGTNPIHYSAAAAGDTTARSNSNDHTVKTTEVGKALTEHSRTNYAWSTQSTPKGYSIGLSGGKSSGNVDITALDSSATAYVPYNFTTTPHKPHKTNPDPKDDPSPTNDNNDNINDNTSEKIVYSGETGTFDFVVDVNPRPNPETNGTYATIVDQAKWRLRLCIGVNECAANKYDYVSQEYGGSPSDKLNVNRKLDGEKGIPLQSLTINIPDRTAGTRICVVAEVWPADSGEYTNWQVSGYSSGWSRSPRSCYTIAKRPSTQVWGGNIFTQSNINTTPSTKNNLYGYSQQQYTYSANANNGKGPYIFGSWGELGVISNGTITGFGSGASMGYASNSGTLSPNPFATNTAASAPNPGGGRGTDLCVRFPLTIPNYPCPASVGNLSSTVSITKATDQKKAIIDLLVSGQNTAGHIVPLDGKVNMGLIGQTIEGSTTKVVNSDNDLVIDGNLIYLNGPYLNYEQMPKLVIYSKKNIYINCDVTRIDALLIAENTVVTCNNFDGNLTNENITKHINDQANSTQLYINGTIIASRLVANRTYGAAAGANSIVPAEIINFDPTLYQFSGSAQADDDTGGRLDATYTHEVAPRL